MPAHRQALDGDALRNTRRFHSAGLRTHDKSNLAFPGLIPVALQGLTFLINKKAVIHRCGGSAGMAPKSATSFPFNAKHLRTERKNVRTLAACKRSCNFN